MVAFSRPEIYRVLCADGSKCWFPGSLGSTWEDCPGPPYLTHEEANKVVADLDDPKFRRSDGTAVPVAPAPCGPHRVQKYAPTA
jgi:hypothetical protein